MQEFLFFNRKKINNPNHKDYTPHNYNVIPIIYGTTLAIIVLAYSTN